LIIFVPVSVSSHIHNVVDHAKGDMRTYKFIIHKQNKTKQNKSLKEMNKEKENPY